MYDFRDIIYGICLFTCKTGMIRNGSGRKENDITEVIPGNFLNSS